MANFCIMRIKKLHSNSNVAGAISHHLRTRETDNADPQKMKLNWFYPNEGKNSPTEKIEYRRKMQKTAIARYKKNLPEKVRKNGVRAVEFLMTVSPEVLERKDFDSIKYLNSCSEWARDKFGSENVFFVAYHLDEKTPHISLLLTPKDENGKLNARKFFGGREKMSALQDDFFNAVGKQFGLERGIKGSKAHHKTIKEFYSELNEKNQTVENVLMNVAEKIPTPKTMQSKTEYRNKVIDVVADEIKSLIPSLTESINANQDRQRLDSLRKNLDEQVKIKTLKMQKDKNDIIKAANEVARDKKELQKKYDETSRKLKAWQNLTPEQLESIAKEKRIQEREQENSFSR